MRRVVAIIFILTIATLTAPGQNLADLHQRFLSLVADRDYSTAIAELERLKANDRTTFENKDYDYLLARLCEWDGQTAFAMINYQGVVNRNSILSPYALTHLSQVARSTGNLMLERLVLQKLLQFYSDSFISAAASERLARNEFESANYGETIRLLTRGFQGNASASPVTPSGTRYARERQALLAEAYLRSGQSQEARNIFTVLLDKMPNPAQPDDVSLSAAKGLDLLDGGVENFGKQAPELTEQEYLRRANIYQFNRDFADAKLHFDAIIDRFPNSENVPDAIFQIGRGFAQASNFVEAAQHYERILEQYPDSATARDALLQDASVYARLGKPKEALSRYRQFIDKYPTDEKLDRAYLNTIDVYRDQTEDFQALRWCAKTQDVFKGKVPEAVAVFDEARIYIAQNDWQHALDDLEMLGKFPDLGGTSIPGGTTQPEINFLRGFVLEQLGRHSEAVDTYLSIADGRGEYYGWLATERLRLMAKSETAPGSITQKADSLSVALKAKDAWTRRQSASDLLRLTENPQLRETAISTLTEALSALPRYSAPPKPKILDLSPPVGSAAARLVSLELYDDAMPELAANLPVSSGTGDDAYSLATYWLRANRGDRALAFIEPLWKNMSPDYPIEIIPREQLELLYPVVYKDPLLRLSRANGVDPRFMLAVMRQESRFQPDAKSSAAARGLMQFIAATADQVAAELGRGNSFEQDELYRPSTSIFFGSKYLGDLFAEFPDQAEAVAASYNGGDDNVKRWIARSRSNTPDRYVSEIVFTQTKDYVYRVMTNYRMYKRLYGDDLRPK
jgi:soluble lytic murein transglycosylase